MEKNSLCQDTLNTFLMCYTHESYRNSLMYYYCHTRLSNILPSNCSIHNTSHITTPYYAIVIRATQSALHLPGFPAIARDKIYKSMLPKEKSSSELQYPTFNWTRIWKNYFFIFSDKKHLIHSHNYLDQFYNYLLHYS